ncbi:hypothetical protein AVEN_257163-1 [Araneus ventricosus]|uniref:Uncharacterized protein n=1 Tax=Araneus ventricosus TaxID=182803 RepID=A0A4Y2RDC1_ARAVE|nr:hypothetical protein AVEN_260147-1 [Araneus ventricosus]GBN73764.1 hypothetical protein AVEN_257163-1 [Araneus ventricosus]
MVAKVGLDGSICLVVSVGFEARNPILLKRPNVFPLVSAKIPTLALLTKKGVRPGEDKRAESRPTSMWRTGFITYNKMLQAFPEQW